MNLNSRLEKLETMLGAGAAVPGVPVIYTISDTPLTHPVADPVLARCAGCNRITRFTIALAEVKGGE